METLLAFFFEDSRAFEHKPKGGKEKLELKKKEIGKYYTDENFIYFDDVKINRKTLSLQKYSSFRGECKSLGILKILKNFDLESQKKIKFSFNKFINILDLKYHFK